MSNILANDVKAQYDRAFATLLGIVENFPEDKWLVPHGDDYYIPCRIAYHLAVFIDSQIAGGYKDPDFASKLPFGAWMKATAETLPDKSTYSAYLKEVLDRAGKALAALDDEKVTAPIEPERARFGSSQIGAHMLIMREMSAHSGELNKMLIEDGKDDVWR